MVQTDKYIACDKTQSLTLNSCQTHTHNVHVHIDSLLNKINNNNNKKYKLEKITILPYLCRTKAIYAREKKEGAQFTEKLMLSLCAFAFHLLQFFSNQSQQYSLNEITWFTLLNIYIYLSL